MDSSRKSLSTNPRSTRSKSKWGSAVVQIPRALEDEDEASDKETSTSQLVVPPSNLGKEGHQSSLLDPSRCAINPADLSETDELVAFRLRRRSTSGSTAFEATEVSPLDDDAPEIRDRTWFLVLLMLITTLYIIIGAYLFSLIEQTEDKQLQLQVLNNQRSMVAALKRILRHFTDCMKNVTDIQTMSSLHEELDNQTTRLTDQFLFNISKLIVFDGWNGKVQADNWSLVRSIRYCFTVITTIGYGDLTARTACGRILTVVYAMFGIPLIVLFSDITGKCLTDLLNKSYFSGSDELNKIKSAVNSCLFKKTNIEYDAESDMDYSIETHTSSIPTEHSDNEAQSLSGSGSGSDKDKIEGEVKHHLSFATFVTTVSKFLPKYNKDRRHSQHVAKFVIDDDEKAREENININITNNSVDTPREDTTPDSYERKESFATPTVNAVSKQSMRSIRSSNSQESFPFPLSPTYKRQQPQSVRKNTLEAIRLVVTDDTSAAPGWWYMGAIISYLCLGASMFMVWEKMSFMISVYGAFITLSTIGFGDIVLGNTYHSYYDPDHIMETEKSYIDVLNHIQKLEDSVSNQSHIVVSLVYIYFGVPFIPIIIRRIEKFLEYHLSNTETQLFVQFRQTKRA